MYSSISHISSKEDGTFKGLMKSHYEHCELKIEYVFYEASSNTLLYYFRWCQFSSVVVFFFFAFKVVLCFKLHAKKSSHMNVNITWVIIKGVLMLPLLQKIFIFTLFTLHCKRRNLVGSWWQQTWIAALSSKAMWPLDNLHFFPLSFGVLTCKVQIKMSAPNTWKVCYTNQNR